MIKLRESAKGQQCFVRLPGVCDFNPETTVLAHLNGGGMALKKSDLQASFCCHKCHDEIDRRTMKYSRDFVELAHRQGVERTQDWWLENGYITIK